MNYFNYAQTQDSYRALQVYKVVQDLKGYAISIYKGLWEEAMDECFFHILKHYNPEKGELVHYATRTMSTVLLNKHKKEIAHETSLLTAMEQKSMETSGMNPLEILVNDDEVIDCSTDIESCIAFLLPKFIEDYKFFKSKKAENRNLSYEGLFKRYSVKTVRRSMELLMKVYGEAMDELLDLKQNCHIRNFSEDRYKKGLDTNIVLESVFQGVVVYRRLSNRVSKKFYSIDLVSVVDKLRDLYFTDKYYKNVGGYDVYCTLSGNIVIGEEALKSTVERELVGCILSKSQCKVVKYEKGNRLIVSSVKDIDNVVVRLFEEDLVIPLDKMVSKCVNK